MSGTGMTEKVPVPLVEPKIDAEASRQFTLSVLGETDEYLRAISADFAKAKMKVKQVELLKNRHLWKRYSTEKDLILEQRGKTDSSFKLNEKYLYHGTSVKKSIICDEGLDSRMAKEGCFGKGIYFSDYPKKCVKYAEKGSGEESHILIVRVILGEAKVYPKGKKERGLKREPEKEEPYTGHRFYDSVEGRPRNHKEFVVYESRRALVEGIITFSVDKTPKEEESVPDLDIEGGSDEENSECGDDECNLSDTSSDNEDDNQHQDDGDNYDSDSSNTSSDSDSNDGDDEDGSERERSVTQMLIQKRRQFCDATGVTDDFEVDRYLLRGNLNVEESVRIYEEKKAADFPESEDEEDDEPPSAVEYPDLNSEAWNKLSKADQDAIVQNLIEDFLAVTGLGKEEEDFARKCLTAVNMNLDHAVLAYYEELGD